MIKELYIENVAVIKKVNINFCNGMSVITGETGAGKSILIDSVNAILGQRVSKDIIRTGEDTALVMATFSDISDLTRQIILNFGLDMEDDELILQRTISRNSKGSARVNGKPVTMSMLKEIGASLIAINGQNESYELLNSQMHMKYIDSMGPYDKLLEQYKLIFNEMISVKSKLNDFNIDESQKAREIDILEYQINEIQEANISVGELENLLSRRDIIANSEKISTAVSIANLSLYGDDDLPGGIALLEKAVNNLSNVSMFYPQLSEICDRLQNSLCEINDCAYETSSLADSIDFNPQELDNIETRLDQLEKLKNKYGQTEQEILDFLEESQNRLDDISFSEEKKERLESEYSRLKNDAVNLSSKITKARLKSSQEFTIKVKSELEFLDMPLVQFCVDIKPCELNQNGSDKLEFLISVNPGESPKPISKIASGGELSRIMLAIKTVLAEHDTLDTLIFDEIDTGVSGSTSQKIGLKLKEVAKNGQVMCVTHSAQIAAVANQHFLISKEVKDDRTYTNIKLLDFEGRKHEIARIIGGVKLTELTLSNAEEMLKANLN